MRPFGLSSLAFSTAILGFAGAGLAQESPNRPIGLEESRSIRQPYDVSLSPDGKWFAYALGDSLYVASAEAVVNGRDPAPLAVAGGMFSQRRTTAYAAWSADGSRLLFRSGDQHRGLGSLMVATLRPILSVGRLLPDTADAALITFYTSLGGGPSMSPDGRTAAFLAQRRSHPEVMELYVADIEAKQVRRVTSDSINKLSVSWSPDGRWLAIASERGTKPGDSASVSLIATRSADWGRPASVWRGPSRYYRNILWAPDGRRLFVTDAETRAAVLELSPAGALSSAAQQLPNGTYVGWNAAGDGLVKRTVKGMNATLSLHRLDGSATPIVEGDMVPRAFGVVRVGATARLLASLQSGGQPEDLWVMTVTPGQPIGRHRATRANPGFVETGAPTVSIRRWVIEGDTLEAQVFMPNTASTGPRPAVVIPYGGFVNVFPRTDFFFELGLLPLASQGYVVIRPNTRGRDTDRRDTGKYGQLQLDDTERLLDQMIAEGLIDRSRIAIYGHSHGGSLAYYYLTRSNRFCGVVASNGRTDWKLQAEQANDGFLVAALGGSPVEVPAQYERSPIRNLANVRAPLLAIAGEQDRQILPQNARMIVDSLTALGKRARLLWFADEGHVIEKPENVDRVWNAIFEFLSVACPRQ
ncbi:MAG: S9 family peptidase [Gemmatimonadales bacterium]|nr:S9 family peptidase [Gemmatimonadales bacterium]